MIVVVVLVFAVVVVAALCLAQWTPATRLPLQAWLVLARQSPSVLSLPSHLAILLLNLLSFRIGRMQEAGRKDSLRSVAQNEVGALRYSNKLRFVENHS